MKKSWEGSLTMAGVSYIICSLVLLGIQGNHWQTWAIALMVAVAATLLEAFSKLGIDNLTVPLGSAVLAAWLNQLL
jgi:phytol kinase